MATAIPADDIVPSAAATGDRRRIQRHGTRQTVAAWHANGQFAAELIELSETGLRLLIDGAQSFRGGQVISVALLDGKRVIGQVTWCRGRQVGVELIDELADVEAIANLDHRGEDLFRQVIKLQSRLRHGR
jgi:PilZ domain